MHTAANIPDAQEFHQPLHLITADIHTVTQGGFPQFTPPVDAPIVLPQAVQTMRGVCLLQFGVGGTEAAGLMGVESARGNRDAVFGEHGTDRLDPEAVPVGTDEIHDYRSLRSSSAWAKKLTPS